jgi:hypothetical protein
MVPRLEWDEKNQKHYFKWESVKPFPQISTVVEHGQVSGLFQKVDINGRLIQRPSRDRLEMATEK